MGGIASGALYEDLEALRQLHILLALLDDVLHINLAEADLLFELTHGTPHAGEFDAHRLQGRLLGHRILRGVRPHQRGVLFKGLGRGAILSRLTEAPLREGFQLLLEHHDLVLHVEDNALDDRIHLRIPGVVEDLPIVAHGFLQLHDLLEDVGEVSDPHLLLLKLGHGLLDIFLHLLDHRRNLAVPLVDGRVGLVDLGVHRHSVLLQEVHLLIEFRQIGLAGELAFRKPRLLADAVHQLPVVFAVRLEDLYAARNIFRIEIFELGEAQGDDFELVPVHQLVALHVLSSLHRRHIVQDTLHPLVQAGQLRHHCLLDAADHLVELLGADGIFAIAGILRRSRQCG
mmetsp:Transcript_95709/g.205356  ORF Transcript_95709/g.205356 Transcript_95709/m.205356 type:complete len:343 (-) Transcript_95709:747-1775(-)